MNKCDSSIWSIQARHMEKCGKNTPELVTEILTAPESEESILL